MNKPKSDTLMIVIFFFLLTVFAYYGSISDFKSLIIGVLISLFITWFVSTTWWIISGKAIIENAKEFNQHIQSNK